MLNLNEYNRYITRFFISVCVFQSCVVFVLVWLDIDLLPKALFDPNLKGYKYPEHQYWLKVISQCSYPFLFFWMFLKGLSVKELRFPPKAGGGHFGIIFMSGCLGVFLLFVDLGGDGGRLMQARRGSLIVTHIYNLVIQISAIIPFIWVLLFITWKLRNRYGYSRE